MVLSIVVYIRFISDIDNLIQANTKSHLESSVINKLSNIKLVLEYIYNNLFKIDFYKIIEQAWYSLGGNIIYSSDKDLDDSKQFFDLIYKLEEYNTVQDINLLEQQVNKLYANNSISNNSIDNNSNTKHTYSIDILTIHKSKGLQFDYVFTPYLDQSSRANDHQMLAWQPYHSANFNGILLAPYYLKQHDQSEFYNTLRFIESQKEKNELARLFYVAATRAIKSCILTASIDGDILEEAKAKEDLSEIKAPSNSVLSLVKNYISDNEYILYNSDNLSKHLTQNTHTEQSNLSEAKSADLEQSENINNKLLYIDYDKYNIKNNYIINNNYKKYLTNKTRDFISH